MNSGVLSQWPCFPGVLSSRVLSVFHFQDLQRYALDVHAFELCLVKFHTIKVLPLNQFFQISGDTSTGCSKDVIFTST